MTPYLTVNTAAEWTCCLAALYCLRTDKDPAWKGLPYYLLIVCLVETMGIYLRLQHRSNAFLYNIYLPLEGLFMSVFLYRLLQPYGVKRWLLFGWTGLFLVLYFAESMSNRFARYSHQVVVLMSVVFVLASLYYFYRVLKSDQYIRLGSYAPFWWVSGVLLFYFGGAVTYVFFKYLLRTPAAVDIHYFVRYIIFKVLNVLLYGSWTYASICRYRQVK
jgi:hypothetical protein